MFKRRRSKVDDITGKRSVSVSDEWYAKVRQSNGTVKVVRLCRDKQAAKAMLAELIREVERDRAGLSDPFREHNAKPLSEHLSDFKRHLAAKENSAKHVEKTARQAEIVAEGCGFKRIPDLDAGRVSNWLKDRRDAGMSPRTSNSYLVSMKGFANWLLKSGRMATNPLAFVAKVNEQVDIRCRRRALSVDEIARLLTATEQGPSFRGLSGRDRAMLYRTALETGFRVSELASLSVNSLNLTAEQPTVIVDPAYSKRRRRDEQPIRREFANDLRAWLDARRDERATIAIADSGDAEPLFASGWHGRSADMLRNDLERARLAWLSEVAEGPLRDAREQDRDFLRAVDSHGERFDFHGLRHSFITHVVNAGVSPKVAQTLARHSTITLTLDRYSHVGLSDTSVAVERLPDYNRSQQSRSVSALG